jgi:lysophospholipase L1-like esterase
MFLHAQSITNTKAFNPLLKKDQQDRLWGAWEQSGSKGVRILLAKLEGDSIVEPLEVSSCCEGKSSSPSFDFDNRGNPWITWINDFQDCHRVWVRNTQSGHYWQVNANVFSPVFSPRILIDNKQSVWIFWVTQDRGPGEIIARRLSKGQWSHQFRLNRDTAFPHLNPDVGLDSSGYPWIVWTAYDGEDYEIFYSRWNGLVWSSESRVTNNQGFSDISPNITVLPGDIVFVVWSQAKIGSRVCYKYLWNREWSETHTFAQREGFNRNPKAAYDSGRIALVWEHTRGDAHQIIAEYVALNPMGFPQENKHKSFFNHPEHFFPWNRRKTSTSPPSLDDTKYLAFGDSITYGVIARTWFPDKGYVPRLESLLKSLLGKAAVINRGYPGERTMEGLARIEDEIAVYKTKYILLMEGTNDMSGGIPSLVAAFNIEEMVKKCQKYGVYPFVGTIIPRSDSLWETGVKERTILFNELVRVIPPAFFTPLTDHYLNYMNHPAGYLTLFSDGAHPNELGYQMLAEAWANSIERLPWPPVNISAKRTINKILFHDEHINVLEWEINPLTTSGAQIAHYLIFRKTKNVGEQEYKIIAAVAADTTTFLDKKISAGLIYNYYIKAEGVNGIQGPASASVTDR